MRTLPIARCRRCRMDLPSSSYPTDVPVCATCLRYPRTEEEDPKQRQERLDAELCAWTRAAEGGLL